jgi:hypothetical protein
MPSPTGQRWLKASDSIWCSKSKATAPGVIRVTFLLHGGRLSPGIFVADAQLLAITNVACGGTTARRCSENGWPSTRLMGEVVFLQTASASGFAPNVREYFSRT